ncbi:MAG: aspartate--tRNA ligase [bacterium]
MLKGEKFMQRLKRTVECGLVSSELLGQQVSVAGWVHSRRDHGGVIFIDLRDRSGIVQLVFMPEELDSVVMDSARALRSEYVIVAQGVLQNRASGMINPKMPTGEFEVIIKEFTLFSACKPLPFQIDAPEHVSEDLRLKYRYLDLRRPVMQQNLKLRHDVIFCIREFLNKKGFWEIETPILSKSTPEGARDFLVPSRLAAGMFYALPQSPQIYKQLLMCSGLEKYFQIARCFRDENLRADRQPEFTQLDLEMSFVDENDIFSVCEEMMAQVMKKILNVNLGLPFKRYAYDDVMSKYGSDKPDLRFDMRIQDLTNLFNKIELPAFLKTILENNGKFGALCVKNKKFSRAQLDGWVEKVTKEYGAQGLIYITFDAAPSCHPGLDPGSIPCPSHKGPISKFLPTDFFAQAQRLIPDLTTSDMLFVVAGQYKQAWDILGKLRLELGKDLNLIDKTRHELFWVTDFPLFEWDQDAKQWQSAHNPFTAPQDGWEELEDLGHVKSRSYDLVWNGCELISGAIRIHDSVVQQKIFDILGISQEAAQNRFGYLLEAQRFGYPPEGGFGLGIDRFVMKLAGHDTIRDVIAFPKTTKGSCLMMETPSDVEQEQLNDLRIKVVEKD